MVTRTMRSTFRGHEIEERGGGRFVFCDTGESVEHTWRDRPCGHCGRFDTPEGHDACLGELPGGVMNACCGHGDVRQAYVQFAPDEIIDGEDARAWIDRVLSDEQEVYA